MIKAIFLDLDGTLLSSKKTITPKTKNALWLCKEKGIKIFIATGRPPLLKTMLSLNDEDLLLFDGGVFCNGGCIQIGKEKEYIPIPIEVINFCIENVNTYKDYNIAFQMENEKHAFRFPLNEKGFNIWGISSNEALTLKNAHDFATVKILIFTTNLVDSTEALSEEIIKDFTDYCSDKAKMYVTDNDKVIQLANINANKMTGIEIIRQKFNIQKNEIAVFGDDINDVEMLSEYEYSFAMGNAQDNIKPFAKYLTLDNNSDGIEYAIRNILKIL